MFSATAILSSRAPGPSRRGHRLALVVLLWPVHLCQADETPTETATNHVHSQSCLALLDVSYVLRHYSAFQRCQEEIDAGAKLAESVIRWQRQELDELSQHLKNLQAGSPAHTELDLVILRRTAELNTQSDVVRRKSAAAQVRAQAGAYQAMVRVVNQYLGETDYRAVLRKDAPGAEMGDRSRHVASLRQKKDAGRTAIFAQSGVDISREILQRLNAGPQKTAGRMLPQARRSPADQHVEATHARPAATHD